MVCECVAPPPCATGPTCGPYRCSSSAAAFMASTLRMGRPSAPREAGMPGQGSRCEPCCLADPPQIQGGQGARPSPRVVAQAPAWASAAHSAQGSDELAWQLGFAGGPCFQARMHTHVHNYTSKKSGQKSPGRASPSNLEASGMLGVTMVASGSRWVLMASATPATQWAQEPRHQVGRCNPVGTSQPSRQLQPANDARRVQNVCAGLATPAAGDRRLAGCQAGTRCAPATWAGGC